jgi:RNA polymerase subunit RPABC4/transcription elongation factor Spt4
MTLKLFCPKCGKLMNPNDKRCKKCGFLHVAENTEGLIDKDLLLD